MNSKIYSIKKYTAKRDDPKIITTGTCREILEALTKDKGYHQLLFNDINYKLFFDIDNVQDNDTQSIYDFFEYLTDEFDIDLTDIKYTQSNKESGKSYHVIIPVFRATLEVQLFLITQIKK